MYTKFALACLMAASAEAMQLNNASAQMPLAQQSLQSLVQTSCTSGFDCHTAQNAAKRGIYDFDERINSKYLFADPGFTPDSSSLYWYQMGEGNGDMAKAEISQKIEWKRAYSAFPGRTLFGSTGINTQDINQGFIGNCWFLAACSLMAESPGRLEDIFVNENGPLNIQGFYAVNLYTLGVPHTVQVDDYLPLTWDSQDGSYKTVFANLGDDGAMWGAILEKAWAKFYGNYEHIIGGQVYKAITTMNGSPYIHHSNADLSADDLWDAIKKYDSAGHMIGAGTPAGSDKTRSSSGLVMGHAYSVLGAYTLSNGVKLVKIRNPHGHDSYKGRYSDGDSNWTPELMAEVGATKDRFDGVIWMEHTDYQQQFDETSLSFDTRKMHYDYYLNLGNTGGSPGSFPWCGASCTRHLLEVTSEVDQDVWINAHTWDKRMIPDQCESARGSKSHSILIPGVRNAQAFKHGASPSKHIAMKAGEKYEITVEFDFTWGGAPDWSLTAWAEDGWVEVKAKDGSLTDKLPVQGKVKEGRDTGKYVYEAPTAVAQSDKSDTYNSFLNEVDAWEADSAGSNGSCNVKASEVISEKTGRTMIIMKNFCKQKADFTILTTIDDFYGQELYETKNADGETLKKSIRPSYRGVAAPSGGQFAEQNFKCGEFDNYKGWGVVVKHQDTAAILLPAGGSLNAIKQDGMNPIAISWA